jgi:hypothetical protein
MACSRQVGQNNDIATASGFSDRRRIGDAELIFVILMIAEIKKTRSAQEYNSPRKS